MKPLRHRLKKKGWSEDELAHLDRTTHHAKKRKRRSTHHLEHIVFYLILITALVGNAIMALFLSTLALVTPTFILLIVTLLLALMFGTTISIILRDQELTRHHYLAFPFILVLVNLLVVVPLFRQANYLSSALNLFHPELLVALVYSAGIILSHFVFHVEEFFS